MGKQRVVETDEGIQGEQETTVYDAMMRRLRDKGWMVTDAILKAGISDGLVLEIGPGPGYLGLEWLKKTEDTSLLGLDVSNDMLELARSNALGYGVADRVEYILGDAQQMVFAGVTFDAAFSSASRARCPSGASRVHGR